jgi:hypothetical protein
MVPPLTTFPYVPSIITLITSGKYPLVAVSNKKNIWTYLDFVAMPIGHDRFLLSPEHTAAMFSFVASDISS